jgi:hypothetical protein
MSKYNSLFLCAVVVLLEWSTVPIESLSIRQRQGVRSTFVADNRRLAATTEKISANDDPFDIPQPRWECPIHDDVCSETGVTLSRYMMEMVRVNPELEEIESSTSHFLAFLQSIFSFLR